MSPERGENVPFTIENHAFTDPFGRETVTYVSNIYKYYIAYKLQLDTLEARRAVTGDGDHPGRPPRQRGLDQAVEPVPFAEQERRTQHDPVEVRLPDDLLAAPLGVDVAQVGIVGRPEHRHVHEPSSARRSRVTARAVITTIVMVSTTPMRPGTMLYWVMRSGL